MRFWTPLAVTGRPLVSIVAAAYTVEQRLRDALMSFVYGFRAQTYDNFELLLVHDGPGSGVVELLAALGDPRIRLIETETRRMSFGHPWRPLGIQQARGSYIGLSNADNWYAPVYLEAMLHSLTRRNVQFAYCDMVHSHQRWRPFATRPTRGRLDLGGWVADAKLVKTTPWTDMGFRGDGTFIDALVRRCGNRVEKVDLTLFVHN